MGIGLLAAAENLSVPAALLPIPRTPRTAWSAVLASQPPGTVVAHVPFSRTGDVDDLAPEAWRMFAQIDHRQPIVNGYASYFPAVQREVMFAMGAGFPDHALACALRRVFGVDLLVVDQGWLGVHHAEMAALGSMLVTTYADDVVTIYRLEPSPAECPPMRLDIGRR
jgi:hypothetical protein